MVRTRNAAGLIVLIASGLLMLALSPLRVAGDIEARLAALTMPITRAAYAAVQPATDMLLHAGQIHHLTDENAALRDQVAQLEAEAAALRQQRSSAEQMQALQAAVGASSGYLAAAVTVRDPAPGRRGLVIDRGADDGVVAGQPVLGPGAVLVGVVAESSHTTARVRLLDDPHSAVAAVIQQSRTPGALAGTDEGLRLDFVPSGATVAVGDLVLTSPIGGLLPPGLLIGRVDAVHTNLEDLFKAIHVAPYTDYDRLLQVMIVTDFRPEPR